MPASYQKPATEKPKAKSEPSSAVVLGIDPGSQFTGFGAVRASGRTIELINYGVIAPPADLSFNERVGILAEEIELLVERVGPDVVVVEKVFLGKNPDSAFKLGHVRGLAIASAIRAGATVTEYATRAVKKGVTGNGAATKEQVQIVLFAALGIGGKVRADASDALALAFYHARNLEVRLGLARNSRDTHERRETKKETKP